MEEAAEPVAEAAAEAADGFDERQIRAACEDDDGYDPYSDRTEVEPLFERDPWA